MEPQDIVRISLALRDDLKRARKNGAQADAPLNAIIDDLQSRYAGFIPKYEAYGRSIRRYAGALGIRLREGDYPLHQWISGNLENLRKGSAPSLANLVVYHLADTRPEFLAAQLLKISDPETPLDVPVQIGGVKIRKKASSLPLIPETLGIRTDPENIFHHSLTQAFNLRDWEIGALRILKERQRRTGLLDLSKLRIDALPDTVGDLTWLEDLSISVTSITKLDGLDRFKNLRVLHCSYGKLRELPNLEGCEKLVQITCGVTPISDIAPVGLCPSIERLYCGSTYVADLTPLRSCPRLQILHCEDTRVSTLNGLEACLELQLIDCSDTAVKSLLPVEGLPALETLLLNGCHIEEHSAAFWQSPALREVIFCRGTLKGIPSHLLSRSFDENCLPRIREYLESSSDAMKPQGCRGFIG
jgi:Leucine-rich repeat (LRR) protein